MSFLFTFFVVLYPGHEIFSGVARSFFSQSVLGWGIFIFFFFFFSRFCFPASGQAVVTGVAPSPPRFLPSIFIAHRVQQSHCSSIVHRVLLLTHALALSASQFVRKKKSQRIFTSVHSAGLGLTKLTYTRLVDNLLRHRDDPLNVHSNHEVFPKDIFSHIPWLACVARYVLHDRSMFLV